MRFAAAHGLRQPEGSCLVTAVLHARESLLEQGLHPDSDEIFLEEAATIYFLFEKVGQVKDDVAAVAIKNAGAGDAVGLECHALHFYSGALG